MEPKRNTIFRPRTWLLGLPCAWCVCFAAAAHAAIGQPDIHLERDVRVVAGLRERQLFSLAEDYAQQRLQKSPQPGIERTDLIVELIRTLAIDAANAPTDEQPTRWKKVQKVSDDYLHARPPPVRPELIQVQQALAGLARGELARLTYEAQADESLAEDARRQLRLARSQLEELQKQLQNEIIARRKVSAGVELTSEELGKLSQNLILQQARLSRNMALTYPIGTDSRLALLLEGSELLKGPMRQLTRTDPLYLQMSIEWMIGQRLLGQIDKVHDFVRGLLAHDLPLDVRLRLYAEGIRLALADHKLANADIIAAQGKKMATSVTPDPEFDFACLELDAANWKQALDAKDASASKQWQTTTIAAAKQLEQMHGAYWGRRADQLLIATAPSSGTGVALDVLRRAAENLYRKGQVAEAVAAFDKAANQAQRQQDSQAQFDFAYKAAVIQQNRQLYEDAALRLQALSLALPQEKQAPQAHLLAAWNYAQAARTAPQQLEKYVAAMAEHVQQWPDDATTENIRVWQGQLFASQGKWDEVTNALAPIPATSPQFATALAVIIPAWVQRIESHQAEGSTAVDPIVTAAGAYYRQVLLGSDNDWPAEWSSQQRQAALAWAKLLVDFRPQSLTEAQQVLSAARQGMPPAEKGWQREADALLVAVLAAQPEKRTEATELLQQLAGASATDLVDLIERLTQVAARSPREVQKSVAELQLQAIALVRPQQAQLSEKLRVDLERIHAQALAAAGQREAALSALKTLAVANPRDGELQELYAQQLAEGDSSTIDAALAQWRKVAAHSKPQTDRWYRAKYAIAELQRRQGESSAAAQLLRYMLETPPGVAAAWKPQFEALLRQCESP